MKKAIRTKEETLKISDGCVWLQDRAHLEPLGVDENGHVFLKEEFVKSAPEEVFMFIKFKNDQIDDEHEEKKLLDVLI